MIKIETTKRDEAMSGMVLTKINGNSNSLQSGSSFDMFWNVKNKMCVNHNEDAVTPM